ncbi:serine/threonine-protein kinase [Pseudonocardia sp. 73-21]|uniref:serine/threonine-protein kinase n=1 Tax=Pseudonocardia sp. 73-21 TaxID=1895809 RepID=UPI00095E3B3B|nr:serine/threonine-protein kinase [Pseudonocardia sp. 73-21]OJY53053.1 MAG: hypothetical protein BGP03_01450 [Pseudonocardia sp. 73-21]
MADHPDLGVPGLTNAVEIGRGGFGTVYSADEPEFGRAVAVKVLRERLGGDDVRRAFARECQAMGSLSGHPNIVGVHRGGATTAGHPYIVMDVMTGGSLADRLERDGPLPWAEVLDRAVSVAGALETAHRAGVLHLDLKPANLFVSRYGETTLGDFGISRMPGVTSSVEGRVRASAAYAAPERLLDGVASVGTDLYGLGATLFALLTGRPAFVGASDEDAVATVARVVRDPLPDLRARGIPDPVALIVERLMAKAPEGRFGSAAEVIGELQRAQHVTGRPVTRAVVEGADPRHGDTATRAAPPVAPPPRPVVQSLAPPPEYAPVTSHGPVFPPLPPSPLPRGGTMVATPLPPPPRPSRRPLVLALVAAVVVVALGVTGGVFLLDRRTTNGGTSTPTFDAAATTAPPAPTTAAAAGLVALAPGITHPATDEVRAVLAGYVSGIDDKRYADAFAYFSPASDPARGGLAKWTHGQSTTAIRDPVITAVRDTGADRVEVDMTFTSTQDATYGPSGQTCTNWRLAYDMQGPGPGWLIRRARTLAPPAAC